MIKVNDVIEIQRTSYDSKYMEKVDYIESCIVSKAKRGCDNLLLSPHESCFSNDREENNNLLRAIKEAGFHVYAKFASGETWGWWEDDAQSIEISWRGMKQK